MSELGRLTQTVLERAAGLTLYARQWLDAASAEDVVQEALTALLVQRPPPDDPIAWMYRAVRNGAIDHARATSRRRQRERAVAERRGEWFEPRPDSAIDARAAEAALAQLSERDREIVILRIWGEMGLVQIAQIVQLSVSTVHGRYVAALSQMRNALEKPCRTKTN
jgi:RNA polymerase sigma factor (sigma-70 family)